ncbi:hypothetical protein ACFL17_07190 [Pseudomonadota bacterium]
MATNARELRKQFLEDSGPALEEIRCRMLGMKSKYPAADGDFLIEYWKAIVPILHKAEDPTPMTKLTDGDISQRVDNILEEVAQGNITTDEGKRLMALLQAGFDITELPKLISALEMAESKSA